MHTCFSVASCACACYVTEEVRAIRNRVCQWDNRGEKKELKADRQIVAGSLASDIIEADISLQVSRWTNASRRSCGFCVVGGRPDDGWKFTINGGSRMFMGMSSCFLPLGVVHLSFSTVHSPVRLLSRLEKTEKMRPILPFTYKLLSAQLNRSLLHKQPRIL